MKAPVVRILSCAMLVWTALGVVSGCAGSEFTSGNAAGALGSSGSSGASGAHSTGGSSANQGGSTTSGGTSGAAGSSAAGTPGEMSCQAPSDCNDRNPCTIDRCQGDGSCDYRPRCASGEVCCGGVCGECCVDEDCDDSVDCTVDSCSDGSCRHVGDDEQCGDNRYCSSVDGCRTRVPCQVDIDCDDGDPCTTDSCQDNVCLRAACADGLSCCPGQGCAECCNDAQCHDPDACTRDSCQDGRCSRPPLCDEGLLCCLSADEQSATCGACCSASDCDDQLACTVDLCTTTGCAHVPDSSQCGTNEICHATLGCQQTSECAGPSECPTSDPCLTPLCQNGRCDFAPCADGQTCCKDGCQGCCADTDCADSFDCTVDRCVEGVCQNEPANERCSTGFECRPSAGGCVECVGAAECDDKNPCTTDRCDGNRCAHGSACATQGKLCCSSGCAECCTDYDCVPSPLPVAPNKLCQSYSCNAGKCVTKSAMCPATSSCCPVGGCILLGLCSLAQ